MSTELRDQIKAAIDDYDYNPVGTVADLAATIVAIVHADPAVRLAFARSEAIDAEPEARLDADRTWWVGDRWVSGPEAMAHNALLARLRAVGGGS